MFQTIQDFSRERLVACHELAGVQRLHAEYMAGLVEQAEPELTGDILVGWLERLELEHDNIRLALGWAIAEGESRLAHRMVAALWRFWWNRGFLHEGRRWFTEALNLGDDDVTPERMHALHGAGQLADVQGDYGPALQMYREALAGARTLNDRALEARLLDAMANEAHDRGRYDEAIRLHEEARTIFAELGDRRGLAACLHNLGTVHYYRSNFDAAERLYRETLSLVRAIGDRRNVGNVLGSLGSVAQAQGNLEQARQLHEQSVEVAKALGDDLGIALAQVNMSEICLQLGNFEEARVLSQSALDVFLRLGAKRLAACAEVNLGGVARGTGDLAQAARYFAQGLTTLVELGDLAKTAECLEHLGSVAGPIGDDLCGIRFFGSAAKIRNATGAQPDTFHREQCEQILAALRHACSEEDFTTAWKAGAAEAMDDLIAEALALAERAATQPADREVEAAAERLGLSRREVEVLRLFATGYTNQQIANSLAISPAIVTSHLGNLYSKLGVESRAGLAALAFTHGLV